MTMIMILIMVLLSYFSTSSPFGLELGASRVQRMQQVDLLHWAL